MDLSNPIVLVAVMGVVAAFIGFLGIVAGLVAASPLQKAMAKKTSSEAESMDANTLVQTRTVYGKMLEDQQAQIKAQQVQMEQQAQRLSFIEAEQAGTAATSTKLVDGLNLNIVDLTNQVADLTEKVAGLRELMEGANNTISEQSTTIKEANETVNRLGEELSGVRQELVAANGIITALNKEVSGLKALMEAANETIASLKQLVSDLVDQIKGLGAKPVGDDAT